MNGEEGEDHITAALFEIAIGSYASIFASSFFFTCMAGISLAFSEKKNNHPLVHTTVLVIAASFPKAK
jgi:uncharacterized membrane protein YbhN (UPF0104 family)